MFWLKWLLIAVVVVGIGSSESALPLWLHSSTTTKHDLKEASIYLRVPNNIQTSTGILTETYLHCSSVTDAQHYYLLDPVHDYSSPSPAVDKPRTALSQSCRNQFLSELHKYTILLTVNYAEGRLQLESIANSRKHALISLSFDPNKQSVFNMGSKSWNITNTLHKAVEGSSKVDWKTFAIALQHRVIYDFDVKLFLLLPSTHPTDKRRQGNTNNNYQHISKEQATTICRQLYDSIHAEGLQSFSLISDHMFRYDTQSLLYWLDFCKLSDALPVIHTRGFPMSSIMASLPIKDDSHQSHCAVKYVHGNISRLKVEDNEDDVLLQTKLSDVRIWDDYVIRYQSKASIANRLFCIEDVLQELLVDKVGGILRYIVATNVWSPVISSDLLHSDDRYFYTRNEMYWREMIATLLACYNLSNLTKIEIRSMHTLSDTFESSSFEDVTSVINLEGTSETMEAPKRASSKMIPSPEETPNLAVGVTSEVFYFIFVSPAHVDIAMHMVNMWKRSCATAACPLFTRIFVIPVQSSEDEERPSETISKECVSNSCSADESWKQFLQQKPSLRSIYLEANAMISELLTERDIVVVLNGLEALLALPSLVEESTEATKQCTDSVVNGMLLKKWRLIPEVSYASYVNFCLPTFLVFASSAADHNNNVNLNMMLGQASYVLRFLNEVASSSSASMGDDELAVLAVDIIHSWQQSNPFLVTFDQSEHFFELHAAQQFLNQYVLPILALTNDQRLTDLPAHRQTALDTLSPSTLTNTHVLHLRSLLEFHLVNVVQCLLNQLPSALHLNSSYSTTKEYFRQNQAAAWLSTSSSLPSSEFDDYFFSESGEVPLPPLLMTLVDENIVTTDGNIDYQQRVSSLSPPPQDLIDLLELPELRLLSNNTSCSTHFEVFLKTFNNLIPFGRTADWLTMMLVSWHMHERVRFCPLYYMRNSVNQLETTDERDSDTIYMSNIYRFFQLSVYANMASQFYSVAHYQRLLHLLFYAQEREQYVWQQLQHIRDTISLNQKQVTIMNALQQASKDTLAALVVITPQIATQFLPFQDAKAVLHSSIAASFPPTSYEDVQKVRQEWDEFRKTKLLASSAKIHFITFASNETIELQHLLNSAILAGIKLQVSGLGEEYRHYGDKIRGYYRVLHRKKSRQETHYQIKDDDIVVLLDAYDVLIFNGVRRLKQVFQHSPTPILFNAEHGIYPEQLGPTAFPRGRAYPSFGGKRPDGLVEESLVGRFINSGVIVGRAKELRELFVYANHLRDVIRDDQQVFYRYMVTHPATISIDTNRLLSCTAFKSQHLTSQMVLSFAGELFLNLTTSSVSKEHFNGSTGLAIEKLVWRLRYRDLHSVAFFHANNRKSNGMYDTLVQYLDSFRTQYLNVSKNKMKLLQLMWAWVDRDISRVKRLISELDASKDVLVQQLQINMQEVEHYLLAD